MDILGWTKVQVRYSRRSDGSASLPAPAKKETITTIADFTDTGKTDDTKLNAVSGILVEMHKAFNSPQYCEGINKYNVRGIYKYWAGRILEIV